MKNIFFVFIFSLSLIMLSCSNDNEAVESEYVSLSVPDYFPELTVDLENNPLSKSGVALGKKLFYDVRLSSDNSISCAECHNQPFAFTHHGHDISEGVQERTGTRNSQPIQNLAFMQDFTWVGGATDLWKQPRTPIVEPVEMDQDLEELVKELEQDKEYVTLFTKAFGSEDPVKIVNILKAFEQFMATMISSNSKYDSYKKGEIKLLDQEEKGRLVFEQKCASCHSGALQTDESYRNNGIGVNERFPDEVGRAAITLDNPFFTVEEAKQSTDYYKFKVPSLRNIEVTYPYMHDGRFYSLRKVLDFYDNDTEPYMQNMSTLDGSLQSNDVLGIDLSKEDKDALEAFLKTLTDEKFLQDENFKKN